MTVPYVEIAPSESAYPSALRGVVEDSPIYAAGNTALLSARAIGICGSRNASTDALEYAFEFGREAAQHGFVVVSGYARGVDRQAHKGALQAGGATIAVLPEGIERFRVNGELHPYVDLQSNFLAISMFEPDAAWTTWRAMNRNKLIVGLSVGLFVIEAREKGGTIDAARQAVRQGKPLWAIAYSTQQPGREGNVKLLQEAAIPLKLHSDLRKALQDASTAAPEPVQQLALSLH